MYFTSVMIFSEYMYYVSPHGAKNVELVLSASIL